MENNCHDRSDNRIRCWRKVYGEVVEQKGLARVSCNTAKFMHCPAGECTNIERTLPRLSDTMQHLSNAQRRAQYTPHCREDQHLHKHTHTHTANTRIYTPMESAIRHTVSFYCLVDNCQELKLEKKEAELRVALLLCSIESIPRTDFA